MRFAALAAVTLTLLLAACGGSDSAPGPKAGESAADAFLRQLDFIDKGQWGRDWDELHPAHQALVSRDKFISCKGEDASDITIKKAEVIETFEESTTIPGTKEKVDSTALTVTVEIAGLFGGEQTDTYHEVLVDGQWRWLMSDPSECTD